MPSILDHFQGTIDYISERKENLNKILRAEYVSNPHSISAYGTSIGATVFSYQFAIEDMISCFFDDDTFAAK